MPQRVVITGIAAIGPCGDNSSTFWEGSLNGRCWITSDRVSPPGAGRFVGGRLDRITVQRVLDRKLQKQTDISTQLALVALNEAITDSQLSLDQRKPEDWSLYIASSFGGIEFSEKELYAQVFLGPNKVSAYQAIAWFYASTQGQWTISQGVKSFAKTIVAGRVAGLEAAIMGVVSIRAGHAKVALCGGSDCPLSPFSMQIHASSGGIADVTDTASLYKPFDKGATGLVLGEGGGSLVLEDLDHALARNAPIYAEVLGFAVNHNKDGPDNLRWQQYSLCLRNALNNAGLQPEEIKCFMADGAASQEADDGEYLAYKRVFLNHRPHVTVPRTMIGHTMAAAGLIDIFWAVKMMQHGLYLPTVNVNNRFHDDMPIVVNLRHDQEIDVIMIGSRGESGINASMVLQRWCGPQCH